MNRIEKHRAPQRRMVRLLREKGYDVKPVLSQQGGYDLLVNGRVRVALRVSSPRMRIHSVVARGKRYRYRYRSWHFNFHHHGQLKERYADVFVCIGLGTRARPDEAIFVIPWASLGGKTFSLLAGGNDYEGRYASYRDRWSVLDEALSEPEAELKRVA